MRRMPRHFLPRSSFPDLPAYTSIIKHRVVADRFNFTDPFYRCHDRSRGSLTTIDGREYVNFASYDYLGLNGHPDVVAAAKAAIDEHGTSVSASRIVAGERPLHRQLEAALADLYETETAVAFVSGHATNVSTISTLLDSSDLILYDELAHNSLLTGIKLSNAKAFAFRHNDLENLERLLRIHRRSSRNALIVVEGLYSMDGDVADLPKLVELKQRYGAWLMVDEAHALGVLGTRGRGLAEHFDVDPAQVDIWMGTLSKALAGCGGYIAGSHELVEALKFRASGQCISVGMSPPVAAAAARRAQAHECRARARGTRARQRRRVPARREGAGARYRHQRRLCDRPDHGGRHHQGRPHDRPHAGARDQRAADHLSGRAAEGGAPALLHHRLAYRRADPKRRCDRGGGAAALGGRIAPPARASRQPAPLERAESWILDQVRG